MKSKLKKSLSLLLALVMAMSCMSLGAFAAGETIDDHIVAYSGYNENSPEVQQWKSYYTHGDVTIAGQSMPNDETFRQQLGISTLAEDYGNLENQPFFIVKFDLSSFQKHVGNGLMRLEFSTDSSETITGYIGQYLQMGGGNIRLWLPVATSFGFMPNEYQSEISVAPSATELVTIGQNSSGLFYADEECVEFGFALTSEISSNTTVTVTMRDTDPSHGSPSETHTYTFSAQPEQPSGEPQEVAVSGISINREAVRLDFVQRDTMVMLYPTVSPGNATDKSVTWSSSDENVATVVGDGTAAQVTAVDRGVATITATAGGHSATCEVTVIREDVTARFDSAGGSKVADVVVKYGLPITEPVNPTREGYSFDGWYTASLYGNKFDFSSGIEPSVYTTVKTFYARWLPVTATVDNATLNSLGAAILATSDESPITVNGATAIAGVEVNAGSTVTVSETMDMVNSTVENATATVTPKTLTISSSGEEAKTAKAYVVSKNEASTVVTDVKLADDSGITNEAPVVENLVDVAQVLANAVAANNSINVSSISSMELSLKKTTENTLPEAVANAMTQANQTNNVAFEVHPVATVKTTTNGATTETTYDVSNDELADDASFTFKLTGLTANQHYTLYHYASDGTLKNTFYQTADGNGEVTLTLSSFSYIVGEESEEATDFATLVARAQPGQTIVLTEDVELTDSIDIDKALTIDLNGHSITPATGSVSGGKFTADTNHDYLLGVKRGGNLTIQDSSTSKTGAINSGDLWVAVKATIKGEAETGDAATITVTGGSITGYYYAISGNGTRHGTVITVNDGTLTGTNGTAIYHPQDGTLTISGGSLTGEDTAVELRSGTLKVTGGTFTATADEYSCSPNGSGTTTSGAALAIAQHTTNKPIDANITGGTYSGVKTISIANPQNNAFDNVEVSGSASLLTDSIEIPEGYEWVTEGGVSTLEKSFVSTQATVSDWETVAWVYAVNLDLLSSIQLNVEMYIPAAYNNGTVVVTFNGVQGDPISVSNLEKDGSLRVISQSVYAAQMDYTMNIALYDAEGKPVEVYVAKNTSANDPSQFTYWKLEDGTYNTSVNKYLDALASSYYSKIATDSTGWYQKWYDFAMATKAYGAAAKTAQAAGVTKP